MTTEMISSPNHLTWYAIGSVICRLLLLPNCHCKLLCQMKIKWVFGRSQAIDLNYNSTIIPDHQKADRQEWCFHKMTLIFNAVMHETCLQHQKKRVLDNFMSQEVVEIYITKSATWLSSFVQWNFRLLAFLQCSNNTIGTHNLLKIS